MGKTAQQPGCLQQLAGVVLGLVLIGACVITGVYWLAQADIEPPATQPADKAVEDDGGQDFRLNLLRENKRAGVLDSWHFTEPHPVVAVGPRFSSLTVKGQNETLGVLYTYWNIEHDSWGRSDESAVVDEMYIVRDDGTENGQTIGWFDPVDGLQRE